MCENIRYFMYKYNLLYNDWYGNLSNIYMKMVAFMYAILQITIIFVLQEQ